MLFVMTQEHVQLHPLLDRIFRSMVHFFMLLWFVILSWYSRLKSVELCIIEYKEENAYFCVHVLGSLALREGLPILETIQPSDILFWFVSQWSPVVNADFYWATCICIVMVLAVFSGNLLPRSIIKCLLPSCRAGLDLGPVSWRPTTIKWWQFSQSNRHSTIGTRLSEYQEVLPLLANDEVRCDCMFANVGNASWYLVCRVPMVEWRLHCENCRHLMVVGLHDTGPWYVKALHLQVLSCPFIVSDALAGISAVQSFSCQLSFWEKETE